MLSPLDPLLSEHLTFGSVLVKTVIAMIFSRDKDWLNYSAISHTISTYTQICTLVNKQPYIAEPILTHTNKFLVYP